MVLIAFELGSTLTVSIYIYIIYKLTLKDMLKIHILKPRLASYKQIWQHRDFSFAYSINENEMSASLSSSWRRVKLDAKEQCYACCICLFRKHVADALRKFNTLLSHAYS